MSVKSFRKLYNSRYFGLVRNSIALAGIATFVVLQSFSAAAAPFVLDTFTGAAGTALESHTGETGATWAKNAAVPGSNLALDGANRLRSTIAGTSVYYSSGVPASNEYDVEADVVYISTPGTRIIVGVNGRYDTTTNTGYTTWYDTSTARWHLYVTTTGGTVELGNFAQALSAGTSYHLKLEIRNATKKVFIDGIERISSTNNANTTLGRAGVVTGFTTASGTGLALDNFNATDAPAPSATAYSLSGSNTAIVGKSYTYTIIPNAAYTGTITPSTSGSGTFSPTSVSFSNESTAKTFTYTPTSATGSPHNISVMSSPVISNPAAITVTVRAQGTQFVSDSFTGITGGNLSSRTGEVGAAWAKHPSASGNIVLSSTNRVRANDASTATYFASGVPAGADYIVQTDVTLVSTSPDYISIAGRVNTSANTMYFFDYSNTRGRWELYKLVGGTLSLLGSSVESFGSVGTTRTVALSLIGTSIQGYVDGVAKISATDSSITAAGRAAVGSFGAATDSTGQHADNFAAFDLVGPASSYALSGPSYGSVNTESSTFTITPNGAYTGTITPATSGSGTFSPSSISFINETTAKTFTYTPSSVTGSPHTISTTSSPGISNPSGIQYLVTSGTTNVTVNSPGWFWSPYNTYISGSTSATMLTMGAYSKVNFTGSSAILSFDVSALVNAGIPAGNYPKLAYSVDGATRTEVQLTPTTTSLVLASNLAPDTHSLYFSMISDLVFTDHWNVPVSPVKVTGLSLDGTGAITSPALRPTNAIFFGDSGTAAYDVNSGDNTIAANDASKGWVPHLGSFLNAEYAQIGYGGQGYTQGAADGTTPAFPVTWSNYYSGQSRLTSGKFSPIPDYVFVMQGGNGGVSDSSLVTTAITNMRNASSTTTKIFTVVPINNAGRANIITGFNNYKSAYPADTQVYLIDMGTLTYPSTDGLHPTEQGYQIIADAMMAAIRSSASPSIAPSVTTVTKDSSANIIELSGVDTYWRPGTPGSPIFTVTGGTGASITSQTITGSLRATITLSAGTSVGTLTISDSVSGASTTVEVTEQPVAPPSGGSGGTATAPPNGKPKRPKSTSQVTTTATTSSEQPTAASREDSSGSSGGPSEERESGLASAKSDDGPKGRFSIIPWVAGIVLTGICLVSAGVAARFLLLGARRGSHY